MYRKFFLKILLISSPVVIVMLLVNIMVDSGSIFKNRSGEIAKIIVSDKNAGIKQIPSGWGDLQISIVEESLKRNKKLPADILVFGSSRSSEIYSEIFQNHTFFNCALPGATILDYIGLYGLYKSNNLLPKYLIISIDPWTFYARKSIVVNKETHHIPDLNTPMKVEPELWENFTKGASFIGITKNINLYSGTRDHFSYNDIVELFNPNYFQLNLNSLIGDFIIETDADYVNHYFIIRSDGGYSLKRQSDIDSNYVNEISKKFIKVHKSQFFISNESGDVYFDYFKKLLTSLKQDNVVPIIYISPVNPIIYDSLSDGMSVTLEEEINVLCKQNNMLLVGSFNPHKYGYHIISNFFMDVYHPVKSVIGKIFLMHESELNAIGINVNELPLEND